VRIVPLAHALTAADSTDEVTRCINAVEAAAANSAVPILVLYPGSQEERHRLPTNLRLRAHLTIGPPSLVPISPAELDSIERVTRALRWYIDGTWLDHYPPHRVAPGRLAAAVATGWLDHQDRQLRAIRPPDDTAMAKTNAALRRHAGPPRAIHRDDPAVRLVLLLDELHNEIATYAYCLVCRRPIRTRDFRARDQDTFWAECSNCKVEWGLRSCGHCGGRYPVLSTRTSRLQLVGHGDDLDRTYGNELLAEPCRQPAPDQPPLFICTSCGICTADDGCGS
jgi:hypothetical protein